MKECLLCNNECESVSHVLWECPAYSSLREILLVALQGMLGLVKSYILDVWQLAIILAFNSHSLRLHLGNWVSLVEEVSCVWEVRQTLVLVCVPQVYVSLLYVLV